MTALTVDLLEDPLGDPSVSALLAEKPEDDAVPTLVWWLTAETLKASVALNAALAHGPGADKPLATALAEAELFADLAMAELADATGVGGSSGSAGQIRAVPGTVSVSAAAATVRRTALPVARMLVSHHPTRPRSLATALARHHRAIVRCRSLSV